MDEATHLVPDREHSAGAVGDVLAAVVASSDDAILTKDLDGNITTWNAAAERIPAVGPDRTPSADRNGSLDARMLTTTDDGS